MIPLALTGCATDTDPLPNTDAACPDVVKLASGESYVTDGNRIWDFEVASVPAMLSISQPGVADGTIEYEWTVNVAGNADNVFGVRYLHDQSPRDVALFAGATAGVFVTYFDHSEVDAIPDMKVAVDGSTIRVSMDELELRSYTKSDHFIFHTSYRSATQMCVDSYDPVTSP